jgi:hypothetical protein
VSQPRQNRRSHFHGSTPFGNTTIYIGSGHPTHNGAHQHDNADMGTFFQTVLAQLAGGMIAGGGQYPL